MNASTLRANARQTLQGRWVKAAIVVLVSTLVSFLLSFLNAIPLIGGVAVMLISIPLSYGLVATFMKFRRNEDFTYTTFLSEGFANFKKVWFVTLRILLKVLPWFILSIVLTVASICLFYITMGSGIVSLLIPYPDITNEFSAYLANALITISFTVLSTTLYIFKAYSYVLSYFILYDEPTLGAKEVVEKSASLMKKNKWRHFCLNLSFIGWAILSVYTFGIGFLFLAPYMQIANIHFYEDLLGRKDIPNSNEDEGNAIKEN